MKHGLYRHPLYLVWGSMRQRCYNTNSVVYSYYGARGIIISPRWIEFLPFYSWAIKNNWEKGLDLDRIDNDRGYGPDNCHFVTRSVNLYNRRRKPGIRTKYCGIQPHGAGFRSSIGVGGKTIHLRTCATEEAAVRLRDLFIIQNNLPVPLQIMTKT